MVAFTAKALLLPLLGAASISALPLPSREAELVRRLDLDVEPKVTLGVNTNIDGESDSYSFVVAPVVSPEVLDNAQVSNTLDETVVALAGVGTNIISKDSDSVTVSKRDNTAIVASPVISPDVLNNVEVNNVANDLFAALALTGTNVKKENSNDIAKRDIVSEVLSQLKGDNTAIVASPVVAGDLANDLSVTESLNDVFLGGALTGTNVKKVDSNDIGKRDLVNDVTGLLSGSGSDNTAIVASPVVAPDVANDLSVSDVLNNGFLGLAGTGTNVDKTNSNDVGKRDNTAIIVSPVISPEVANDLSISDVLNDGFIGLAGTGTNVQRINSNNESSKRAPRVKPSRKFLKL